MKLNPLLEKSGRAERGPDDAMVTGFAIDHRKVAPGTIFGAFEGTVVNGEDFIDAAVAAGAVAVVARPEARVEGALHISDAVPRRAFAQISARYFTPVPATIVAVTGTNGKTSTAEMTRQLWRMLGERAASIGTLGVTTHDESISTGLTTPDIVTFHSNLAGLAREGVTHLAFEASSHGLSQYRNEGVPVRAAAFTNFSRDHLDYHETMEAYFEAKMRLFDEVVDDDGVAVIWADGSEWSAKARQRAQKRGLGVFTVGPKGEDITLVEQEPTQLGQGLEIARNGERRTIRLPLIGAYQAANALTAAGLALATGADETRLWDAVGRLQPVRGRLERAVITQSGAPVYVDYAHTPDALEAAMEALRPHVDATKDGRLIVVFGAGGDRDRGKRAEMGRGASECADLAVVTDDNPRGEDAAEIRSAILSGMTSDALEIGDRRTGIATAIEQAGSGDIVLVAGKGHEQGQIIGSGETMRVHPFDDVTVARECAAAESAA